MAKTKDKEPSAESAKELKAEREDGEAEPGKAKKPAAKKWFSIKLLAIAVTAVIAVGALGGGGYYFLVIRRNGNAAASIKLPVFFNMPNILVNLSTSGDDHTQYLKVQVVLQLPDAAMETQIKALMPRLLDAFQSYLRELRPTDLAGSAGLYRLREELTRRVNAIIAPDRVEAVLFKEIIIQ